MHHRNQSGCTTKASITPRGEKFLAQVRIKQDETVIFSKSRVFATRAQAASWGAWLEASVKAEGPAKHASSKTTVGELVRMHLKAKLQVKSLLGRSTIYNHEMVLPGCNYPELRSR